MSTTGKGFRYPVYTDTPDIPRDLGYLAADVDAYLDVHPGPQGPAGPSNTITIGTVSTVDSTVSAAATITGTSPNQVLNLTIPKGTDGIIGGPGPSNVLTVGTTTTGAAGTQAQVTITGTSPAQVINFVIPTGATGATGAAGATGPKGDAAATILVNSTTTGSAGTNASVTNSGTSSEVKLDFVIPRGADGAVGPTGPAGPVGTNANVDPVSAKISLNIPTTSGIGVNSNWYPSVSNFYYLGQTADSGTGALARYWKGAYLGSSTVVTSDARTKENTSSTDLGLSFIEDLNPVKYQIVGNESGRWHYGLIAQEVKSSVDKFKIQDFGGWVKTDLNDSNSLEALRYEEFISPMIKAIQELAVRVKALEEK